MKKEDLQKALEHIREAEFILKKYEETNEISLVKEYLIKASMLVRSLWLNTKNDKK